MEPSLSKQTRVRICFGFVAALLVLWSALLTQPLPGADGGSGTATYSHGILHLTIPYHADRRGEGQLTVEVLDPEDHVLGELKKALEVAEGPSVWKEQVRLDKPLPLDELVWNRVRYRFQYQDTRLADLQGTESIFELLRMPVLHILAQQSYLEGSRAAVRVVVTDSRNEALPGRSSLRIDLQAPGRSRLTLFTGQLNRRNTAAAQFRLPAGLTGKCELHYVVDTSVGSTEYTQTIRLQDKAGILLTTEKPIYQPGQMIHARALALDRADQEAVHNRALVFEVEDSRGNKVFKKATRTDEFGIASAEFELASEVNLGTYHLRALLGEAGSDSANSAEIALHVEKYVLPKFKVDLNFTSGKEKQKHGYRPGDHVRGTVQANYFFGKPLDTAEVSIKATGMDVTTFLAASVKGETDHDGAYHFDLQLPGYLAGRPLSQGAARLLVEATVKDSAGHSETRGEPLMVSESAFLITAVPEGGTLIPGLENQVFLLASYPDGSPVQADLKARSTTGSAQSVRSDQGGVAVINLRTPQRGETLQIEGRDNQGETVSATVSLPLRDGDEQVLLRSERAVYRSGDAIRLKVLTTRKHGTAYVDIVKEGQTILTRDLDLNDGAADLTLVAGPEMAGTVDLNAYVFGQNAQPVADHRLIFVQPAVELKIEAVADARVYKPGDDTHVRFHITDAQGHGVQAALGLQIVDEAVFALAEKQPGFAKVFFYLEQEVMKPRYEIHSIGLAEVVEPVSQRQQEQRDRAARALFAATEIVSQNQFETEVGRTVPQAKYYEYLQRYGTQFRTNVDKIAGQLRRSFEDNPKQKDLLTAFEKLSDSGKPEFQDPWGTRLTLEAVPWDPSKTQYILRSAGMDKQFKTSDDMFGSLYFRRNKVKASPVVEKSDILPHIEHDRGPNNERAEISGTVVDPSGAVVANAVVRAKNNSSGHSVTIHADAEGKFHLTALRPGNYRVDVSSPGFRQAEGSFPLEPRDRAELGVRLMVGATTQTVEVTSASATIETSVSFGVPAGVAGGVPGGVLGGMVGGVLRDKAEVRMVSPAPPNALRLNSRNFTQLATLSSEQETSPDVHVRSYFPEALYIHPEIITDRNGNASISIPLADNITTWRMSMLASTQHGALGTATSSLKVFQDFFVDLDLPVTLTQGDRVRIPVAIYNYSEVKGDVHLQLKSGDWFSLVDDTAQKSVNVDAGQVGGSQFTLEARRIGKFKLTLSAQLTGEAKRSDVVVREIEVVPNGREQSMVFNGQLESAVSHNLEFPPRSIPDASKIFVRLYPGPLSQIMEGMDSLLSMPGGCFEQTSSSTYPNVLALGYMKRTKKLTPEVHAKAEGYIANGYQRLLTFEVPGGGFSWFGQAPANKILTAYGLMEFYDMSKVHDVDPRLIERTQQWLATQQLADGSWKPDTSFINEGATNRYNSDVLRITAYLAWSLGSTGYQGPAIEKAGQFIHDHVSAKMDAYTLAVLGNFAVDYGKDRDFTRQAMQLLLDARTEKDDQVWWSAEETSVYATGTSAIIETTGLAAQALLKWGQASGTTQRALHYLTTKKDATGAWGSTQATIMALRALLLASEKGTADVRGTVEIVMNGKVASKLTLTPDNNDLLHQFVFKDIEANRTNVVELRFDGQGALGYQTAGQYFIPWDEKPEKEPLSLSVTYDRTKLAQDDIVGATATVTNNLTKTAKMVMVDLGIPPGFDLLTEDLQDYQEKSASLKSGHLEKFNLTATQAILYFDSFAPGDTVQLRFRLRAKYPVRARTFRSLVYEYYDPEVNSVARPVQLEVRKR
jgi:hypothetical protein